MNMNQPQSNRLEHCPRCGGEAANDHFHPNRLLISPFEIMLYKIATDRTGCQPYRPSPHCLHWLDATPRWVMDHPAWRSYTYTDRFLHPLHRIYGLESGYCHHNAWALAYQWPTKFQCWTGIVMEDNATELDPIWVRHSWVTAKVGRNVGQIYETCRWNFQHYIGIPLTVQEIASHCACGDDSTATPGMCYPEFSINNHQAQLKIFGQTYQQISDKPEDIQKRKMFTCLTAEPRTPLVPPLTLASILRS